MNWQSIPVLETDTALPLELNGRRTDVVHGGRRPRTLDQRALRVIDARVALRAGVHLLAGGARVARRLGLEPRRRRRRGVVVLERLRHLRRGRKVQQVVRAHAAARVLLAAAVQAFGIASTHPGVLPSRGNVAAVRVGAVLRGGAAVPASGRHQAAAVLDCSARCGTAASRHIPLPLSLVAGLAPVRVVARAAAGVPVDRGLAGGLD